MAQLNASAPERDTWTPAQSRAQLYAIAWLRWRIFANIFRGRKKRSAGRWIVIILLRVVVWAILGSIFLAPIAVCGGAGYFAAARNRPDILATALWAIFLIGLFVSINISPTTLGFDLTPLLRFPLRFHQYLTVRLVFGLVAIPTVVANLALAAMAIGIGVARPSLLPWAALVLGIFALHNIFFLRMIFAWIDRWMGTRRAREILGGVVLVGSLSLQFFFTGPSSRHTNRFATAAHLLTPLHPVSQYLPPSLAADAISGLLGARHAIAPAVANLLGVVAFGLAFLAIFAVRLRSEFRGENLSEAIARAPKQARSSQARALSEAQIAEASQSTPASKTAFQVPAPIRACLTKELIYLKRSGAQLYGLITPIFLVFILARRHTYFGTTRLLLPYAVSYTIIGLLGNLYNVLGADGPGFNFYLLAPVRLRDVILAKNLVSIGVIAAEILLTCAAVSFINGGVPQAAIVVATLAWATFAVLVNLSAGNLRSMLAPMRFELGKTRRPPTSKGSGLISVGVLLCTIAVGAPIIYLCNRFANLWLATPIFVVLAGVALAAYLLLLGRIDAMAATHRESLVEALCKPA